MRDELQTTSRADERAGIAVFTLRLILRVQVEFGFKALHERLGQTTMQLY
ncbi:MAG: hypothetical protein QM651_01140 [Rhodoblastus sp.]